VRRGYFILLTVGLLILFGCAQQECGPLPGTAPEQIIEVEVVDQVITYHCFHDFKAFDDLSLIYPCHCTQHKQKIREVFKGKALECGAGLVIEL